MYRGDELLCDVCGGPGVWPNGCTQVRTGQTAGHHVWVDARVSQIYPQKDIDVCDPCRLKIFQAAVQEVTERMERPDVPRTATATA